MSKKLTVYFTSDTHGYLYPTHFRDLDFHPMGLLSMRFPKDENTLIIDGGDTIQGSPLTYFCRVNGLAIPAAEAMNDRGYDYVTLGNHDFNLGRQRLAAYLKELKAECLCANVRDETGELPILPWTVRTMGNGLRVGLIGLVTSWVNRWEKPENLAGLRVSDPLQAAREAVSALREKADVLIGIYHGGIEKNLETGALLSETDENIACRLCEELPLDLLLTGHQHMAFPGAEWHGTWMVQPPPNAEAYVKVEMEEDGRFTSCLLPVPDHAELTASQKTLLERLNTWLDQPVGHLNRPLRPQPHLKMALEDSSIADFFNMVQLHASGADLSCTGLGNTVRGFAKEVTVRDVVASYIYTNTLVVLRVTGKILREALEQCATFFETDETGEVRVSAAFLEPKEAYYNYDYFAGITYVIDLNCPPGRRVTDIRKDGRPVQPEDSFSLCMNDYRATGTGGFEMYCGCPRLREIQTDVSELILDELRSRDLIVLPEEHPYRVILPGTAHNKTCPTDEI